MGRVLHSPLAIVMISSVAACSLFTDLSGFSNGAPPASDVMPATAADPSGDRPDGGRSEDTRVGTPPDGAADSGIVTSPDGAVDAAIDAAIDAAACSKLVVGQFCGDGSECCSNNCYAGRCEKNSAGSRCSKDSACASNNCSVSHCQ